MPLVKHHAATAAPFGRKYITNDIDLLVEVDRANEDVCNSIGVRKAPRPNGRAGWERIDSVHQGDLDGFKGVYRIICVGVLGSSQQEAFSDLQ